MTRISWQAVIPTAAQIVDSSASRLTLRQLFYVLVADGTIPNTDSAYKTLSDRSAKARRSGEFPDLLDQTRGTVQVQSYDSANQALHFLRQKFRLDRTIGQPLQVWIGTEKRGQVEQLFDWFGELGLPMVPLGGWSSQTFVNDVKEAVVADGRPSVFIYAGDFDPSGWFILEDFASRVGMFDKVRRIAVNPDQITALGLVENPAPDKTRRDSRADRFAEMFGSVRQVEIEAVPVESLRRLYAHAIAVYWDESAYEAVREREAAERALL